jgi:class 3 adenylate cyclase
VDVGDWLRELDLEQYEAAFRENGVNEEDLRHLTAEDLQDLGVVAVGHRRRLLVAIAALRSNTMSAEAPAQVSSSPTLTEPAGSTAERRPLSVMFCDLIGSTALSARLDPEDLREVIRSYQDRVRATLQQFNGFIARYVGDGVLIYFERHMRPTLHAPCALALPWPPRSVRHPWVVRRCRCVSASRPGWW